MPIDFYNNSEPHGVLANTYPTSFSIQVNGSSLTAKTVEHAYQGIKGMMAGRISEGEAVIVGSAGGATRDLRTYTEQAGWNRNNGGFHSSKDQIMASLVRAKVTQNPTTFSAEIEQAKAGQTFSEASPTDSYWGAAKQQDGSPGKDKLGAIVTQELRAADAASAYTPGFTIDGKTIAIV